MEGKVRCHKFGVRPVENEHLYFYARLTFFLNEVKDPAAPDKCNGANRHSHDAANTGMRSLHAAWAVLAVAGSFALLMMRDWRLARIAVARCLSVNIFLECSTFTTAG